MPIEFINPLVYPLLSGLTGALIVFVGGEILRWRRESAYRKSLVALLDEELNLIFHQLKTIDKSTVLITSVWDEKKIEFAKFLSPEEIRELCRLYFWFHQISDKPLTFAAIDLTELRLNTSKTQEWLKRKG